MNSNGRKKFPKECINAVMMFYYDTLEQDQICRKKITNNSLREGFSFPHILL